MLDHSHDWRGFRLLANDTVVSNKVNGPKGEGPAPRKSFEETGPSVWLRGQDLNLRPWGYEGDFTQPADGRHHSCFQSFRVVRRSWESTEVHIGIRESPLVWTRSGQSSRRAPYRILNAIRIAPADLKVFLAAQRAVTP